MMYLRLIVNLFFGRFDRGDIVVGPGATERSFCMPAPVRLLLSSLILLLCVACSSDTGSMVPDQTSTPDGTNVMRTSDRGSVPSPRTEVVAICNVDLPPRVDHDSEKHQPTLVECLESFEMAEQVLRPGKKIYIFDEIGLLEFDTDTQIMFLDQRIRPLSETYQLLEHWARHDSYQELRVRRDSYGWSDPVGFMFSLPKMEVLAVCNLHRETFTLQECKNAYEEAGHRLNFGEKFFLYGEDGILWHDVLVKHEDYNSLLTMPEAVAKVSYPSAAGVQRIRVKVEGKSWSDPIILNMGVLQPGKPMILEVCTDKMRSCTPGLLRRSDEPFLMDSIGLAALEQSHMWMETIIDDNDAFVACYPLALARQNGADHCKVELHTPSNYSGGTHTFRTRLTNVLGAGEWSDEFEIVLEDGALTSVNIDISGSGSQPNAEIAAFSSFYMCAETKADDEGNFRLSIPTECAPDSTTLKIVTKDRDSFMRKTMTFDVMGANNINMLPQEADDPRGKVIFVLALFEPWSYARLIFNDLITSFRTEEAESFLSGNLTWFADYIDDSWLPEATQLSELANRYNQISNEFWFIDRDEPEEIQKEIDKTGSVDPDRLERWVEEIEAYQETSDNIMAEIWSIVDRLQTECRSLSDEDISICTEDFNDRSSRLRSLYESVNHPGTY